MLSFECIKNEKSVYFLLTSAPAGFLFRWLPANLVLGSWHLFTAFAAQTFSWQTAAEQVLAHSRLKTAAITHQVHLPPTKKSPYGLFFANSFYIRRS